MKREDFLILFNVEMSQDGFILVLGCEAGISEVTIDVAPFAKTTIIEELEIVCDDEGDDVISQTFLEHDEATYTTIAILERMNLLKADMEIKDVFKRFLLDGIVF